MNARYHSPWEVADVAELARILGLRRDAVQLVRAHGVNLNHAKRRRLVHGLVALALRHSGLAAVK